MSRAPTGAPARRPVAVVALALLVLGLVAGALGPARAAEARGDPGSRTYRPPVDAPVLDPFREPPEPWLAGNRGIEYETVPGTPVTAIGPGVVTFAGAVAGHRWVTVLHPDGLRSSYGVAAVHVRRGQRVRGGTVLGVAGATLHLGVRRGRTYLDPASLWGTRVGGGRVALVPLDGGRRSRERPFLGPTRGRR